MTQLDILIKIAEAYTILMKLMVKNAEYARIKAATSLKNLSEKNSTQLNNEVSNDIVLTDEDFVNIEKIFLYILQALNEEQSDYENVYRLSESFKQVLSSFKIVRKEMPSTLLQLYNSALQKIVITANNRLIVEQLRNMIYKN